MSYYTEGDYKIDYNNDTGPRDDYFKEWVYVVKISSGNVVCECGSEIDAEIIIKALVAYENFDHSIK